MTGPDHQTHWGCHTSGLSFPLHVIRGYRLALHTQVWLQAV